MCPVHGGLYNSYTTLRPRRNEQHFADDIFKRIFIYENIWISIKISLKFFPKGPINSFPALVQITATSHYLNHWWLVYRRIYASLGLNELICQVFHCKLIIVQCNHQWNHYHNYWCHYITRFIINIIIFIFNLFLCWFLHRCRRLRKIFVIFWPVIYQEFVGRLSPIKTWLCDILALVWHFGPACVTFRPGLCDILALSCVTKASACHHTPILITGAVYRKFHRSSVSKTI